MFLALAIVFVVATAHPVFPQCSGDCDGDGSVAVAELVRAVKISLQGLSPEECPASDDDMDGVVSVSELVLMVGAALEGCDLQEPTPTRVPVFPTPNLDRAGECEPCSFFSFFACRMECVTAFCRPGPTTSECSAACRESCQPCQDGLSCLEHLVGTNPCGNVTMACFR